MYAQIIFPSVNEFLNGEIFAVHVDDAGVRRKENKCISMYLKETKPVNNGVISS